MSSSGLDLRFLENEINDSTFDTSSSSSNSVSLCNRTLCVCGSDTSSSSSSSISSSSDTSLVAGIANLSFGLNVLIIGAAGKVAYALIPMLGLGHAFGDIMKISCLRLFDLPEKESELRGLVMETRDGNFEYINSVYYTISPERAFTGVDVAIIVSGVTGKIEEDDLNILKSNKRMFQTLGFYFSQYSSTDIKIIVASNPANTNAFILKQSFEGLPPQNITSLMRLDQNRAVARFSEYYKVDKSQIANVVVWGDNSNKQYPSLEHARVSNRELNDEDEDLVRFEYEKLLKNNRGREKEVVNHLQHPSRFSVAKAICDQLKDWYLGTSNESIVTMGVKSGGAYGIPNNIYIGLPVRCLGNFEYRVAADLAISEEIVGRLKSCVKKLEIQSFIATMD